MNIKEFIELYKIIMNKHSWRTLHKNYKNNRKSVKYIDCSIDTRTGEVFSVKFRSENSHIFNNGDALNPKNMKKNIYRWLEGDEN